ncbi:E3 SUMO-protein ligase ZBED1-like [Melanotaenia boesemani]|uniref:E3 SUMO-protein ligase ZBED1-like n=1 Tax=Melanotaenia boesemani TaxID=1250792 RepID=UPI001C049BA9|nr:E3 SUMO-protein ligase ZBED1-like [Melanotaenia boesemani]
MLQHVSRHHSELALPPTPPQERRLAKGQTTLTNTFASPLAHNSPRAKAITRSIAVYIVKDMRPFSTVENEGFQEMIRTLEPKYSIPSRPHFSQMVMPELYRQVKAHVVAVLGEATNVAITTDRWTSRATQSYVTITAHVITAEWEMVSFVLQTHPLFEKHSGSNIAQVLRDSVSEWKLERPKHGIAVVTDNARNMDVAVREAGLEPHIKCFAHTLNLATQAGLAVLRVSRLLGRIRRIVSFFHRSPSATAVLASKQKALNQDNRHKLIMDVTTRWNSSLDMVERFLEQQAAVAAALLSADIRRNACEIDTLDSSDIRDAEDVVKFLKPLKTATTVLSDEHNPTVSLILPLKHMIEQTMRQYEDDSVTVTSIKAAILSNLSDRYAREYHHLLECTAVDPRFHTLPHLEENQRQDVFQRLKDKAVQLHNQTSLYVENTSDARTEPSASTPAAQQVTELTDTATAQPSPPPPKKTALEDLLEGTFVTPAQAAPGNHMNGVETEISRYRSEAAIPLTSCPLKWWKENSEIYPLLSPLAKAYLTTPATSVPSERVFSTAGDIVTLQRSQLLPENVDILVFLKKNMPKKH